VPNYTAVDGVALSASTYNANVRDQVVTTCTNATRPAGTEGQWIFETDTGRMFVHDGSAFVQFGGVVAGASFTHNPQVDQGATTNISKTLSYSQYQIMGNLCWWSFGFTLLAGGSAGSPVTLTTPVTMSATGMGVGGGRVFDNSTTTAYVGLWRPTSTTQIACFVDAVASSAAWGQLPNLAAATSDGFYGSLWLPIA
jgi:hypothetical protein